MLNLIKKNVLCKFWCKQKKAHTKQLQPSGERARATRERDRHTRTHKSDNSHSGHGSSHHEKWIKRGPRLP